jgi:hypothetical protein
MTEVSHLCELASGYLGQCEYSEALDAALQATKADESR